MTLNRASRLRLLLEEIKYEQTLFSLPLIYVGALFGSDFRLTLAQVFLIAVAASSARALGMLLNRIVDISIDRLNPRTQNRHLASGRLNLAQALLASLVLLIVYVFSAYLLGPVPLKLSWIPVLMFAAYPYMKRFTWLCHFFLGLTHGLAPLAGWIAVNPLFSFPPFLLYATSFFWVSGFDIYYATMDYEFDRSHGVYSIPAAFGMKIVPALTFFLHTLASLSIMAFSFIMPSSALFKISTFAASVFLLYNDMRYTKSLGTANINLYLQRNSFFSVIVFSGALIEYALKFLP